MRGKVILGSTAQKELQALRGKDSVSVERLRAFRKLLKHIRRHDGTFPNKDDIGGHYLVREFFEFWGFSLDLLRLHDEAARLRREYSGDEDLQDVIDRLYREEDTLRVVLRVIWKDMKNCKAPKLGVSLDKAINDGRFPNLEALIRKADASDVDFFIHIWVIGIDYHDPTVPIPRSHDTNSFLSVIMDYL